MAKKPTPQSNRPAPLELLPLGAEAIIVRFSRRPDAQANAAALAYVRKLEARALPGLVEIVPSLASVLVRFDPVRLTRAQVLAVLGQLGEGQDWANVAPPPPTRRWTIPAVFGGAFGPQLAEAAGLAGLTEKAALVDFTQTKLRLLAIGFAPGQPYLGLLPDAWNIPRQSALTPEVPEGALVVALRQLVLFANPSMTGWRQVGQCAFRLFRPAAAVPFPLQVGDEVRFEAVSPSDFATIQASEAAGVHQARLEHL